MNIHDLFLPESIKNEDYTDPQSKLFIEFFGLNPKLFSNAFDSSVLSGYNYVSQKLEIPNANIRILLKGMIWYGYHYCDISKAGTVKEFEVDKNYFYRATNLLDAIAVYKSTLNGSRIDIKLTTETHEILIRVISTIYQYKKPDEIHIYWELKSDSSKSVFFDY